MATTSDSDVIRLTNDAAQELRFAALLGSSTAFDKEWFKSAASRVAKLRGELVAVILASLIPTSYLALTLLHVQVEPPFIKIADPGRLFQVALLVTCFLGLPGAAIALAHAQCQRLLDIWVQQRVGALGADLYLLAFNVSLYAMPKIFDPLPSFAAPTSDSATARRIASLCLLGVGGVVGAVTFAVQICGIVQVWWMPGKLAYVVFVLSILMTIINFFLLYPIFGWPRRFLRN